MLKTFSNCVRLGRPYYVLPVIATAAAGYLSGGTDVSFLKLAILCFAFALVGMSCWSANEITDTQLDARGSTKYKWGLYVSGGTKVLSSGLVSVRAVAVCTGLLAVAGLAIASALGTGCWCLCFLFLVVGMAYSIQPVRLKDRGILGLAAVAAAYGIIAFAAGWVAGGYEMSGGALMFAGILSVAFFGFEGIPHLLDHEQDRINGERTIAVYLGCNRARYVLVLCQCLPPLTFLMVRLFAHTVLSQMNVAVLVPVLVASVLVAAATAARQEESSLRVMRILSVPLMSGFAFLLA